MPKSPNATMSPRKASARRQKKHSPATSGAVIARNVSTPGQGPTIVISRMVDSPTLISSTTLEVVRNYKYKLSDVPVSTDFTNLFDQYRILEIEQVFFPVVDTSFDSSVWTDPRLFLAPDFDGSSVAAVSDICQYDTAQVFDSRHTTAIKFKPRAAMAAYSGAFTSFGMASQGQWFDVASPSVEYYGLAAGIYAQNVITTIRSSSRYVIEFRRTR